jgi:enamine deaminase RidA (YjgF/YER057c/UK114 family)
MPHQRFRPYEHSLSYRGEVFEYELAMAVKAGNRIWIRGQTGLDLDGSFVGEGDPAAQAENAMRCTDVLLREAGASLSDIVKTTVYLTHRDYRTPVFSVLARWLKGVRPCQTGLIVNGLARPEMLMEIDVEAVIAASVATDV